MCSGLREVLVGVVSLAGVVGMAGCGGQEEQQVMLGEMATQQQHWTQSAPSRYEISIQYDCFCGDGSVRSVVDGGSVVDIAPAGAQPFTVESLLTEARSMLAHGFASASAEYDPDLGYPTRFAIDPQRDWIDDEWGFHVTCFATADAHCPADAAGPASLGQP